MAVNDSTQTNPEFILLCMVYEIYIPTDMKAIALQTGIAITNIGISFFGTVAHILVIVAYYRNHRLRTIQNTVFLFLAFTDSSVTAVVQPVFVATIVSSSLGFRSCLLWDITCALLLLFLQLSLVTIVLLSLQSYLTLAFPYRAMNVITKSRVIVAILLSWILVAIWTVGYFLQQPVFLYAGPFIVSFNIFIVVFTWCWTYKLIARHHKAIQTTQSPSSNENVSQKRILRSTITAFAIIIGLLACYLFAMCNFIVWRITSYSGVDHNTVAILNSISATLLFLNSLINPCLVFWRCTSFRDSVKSLFSS